MNKISRRRFMQASALASTGAALGLGGLPALAHSPRRQEDQEYVYLSIVPQVPFWVDHQQALTDAGTLLGVKTPFTGPVHFTLTAQPQQLDELVARRPPGIVIFIGIVWLSRSTAIAEAFEEASTGKPGAAGESATLL